jgi:hypothetical protein
VAIRIGARIFRDRQQESPDEFVDNPSTQAHRARHNQPRRPVWIRKNSAKPPCDAEVQGGKRNSDRGLCHHAPHPFLIHGFARKLVEVFIPRLPKAGNVNLDHFLGKAKPVE